MPSQPRRLNFAPSKAGRLTHHLFRYPAKFHPPVVRHLIEEYTSPADTILDPFCGSGTLLVEAAVKGRSAIGVDIDPLAVFVSRAKTHRYDVEALRSAAHEVLQSLREVARGSREYARRQFVDITPLAAKRAVLRENLWVPEIPNLFHWFRGYVVVDLARIRALIMRYEVTETVREFLLLCFAAIIRSASNADPVPVSGLEVTAHMRRRDAAGRIINPFDLYERAVNRSLDDVESFVEVADRSAVVVAVQGDATDLVPCLEKRVDAVVTSPPYNIAVDYYRRHQLEMFWLGLTETHQDRLDLLPKYIGRARVPKSHPFVADGSIDTPLVKSWETMIREVSTERADSFKHYVVAMHKVFDQLGALLKPSGSAVFVVGHNSWNGRSIPTGELFVEMAGASMSLVDHFWYPISNRYMSYSRHNGASIDREYVLVMTRR